MSLTPEEIAMCQDALLEAGVPTGVIDRILWTRDRLRRFRSIEMIDEKYGPYPEGLIKSVKHVLHQNIIMHLIEQGIVEVKETRNFGNNLFSLDLTVLTPPGWEPPAKVPR